MTVPRRTRRRWVISPQLPGGRLLARLWRSKGGSYRRGNNAPLPGIRSRGSKMPVVGNLEEESKLAECTLTPYALRWTIVMLLLRRNRRTGKRRGVTTWYLAHVPCQPHQTYRSYSRFKYKLKWSSVPLLEVKGGNILLRLKLFPIKHHFTNIIIESHSIRCGSHVISSKAQQTSPNRTSSLT